MRYLMPALVVLVLTVSSCSTNKHVGPAEGEKWISMHLLNFTSDSALDVLTQELPAIAERGVNVLFLEVDYSFEFQTHPELRMEEFITKKAAEKFGKACRESGIRLIPQFQSLGHQSWAKQTFTLLTVYPELDLTPGAFPNNDSLYCREWDVTNPKVHEIVFPLIDEIVEAFGVDGVHLGMDEVFLLSSDKAPNTKDKDPATLFANEVIAFHDYFTKKKNVQLFIWADRLIDGNVYKYGEWEASMNGTAPAVDLIPKDIVLCDWHYEPMTEYGSVSMFLDKGFKVLPCSWRNIDGVKALVNYSYKLNNPNMLGHMFTTWSRLKKDSIASYKPLVAGVEAIKGVK